MQIVLLVLAMLVSVSTAYAETLVPPEVVRLENVKVEGDIRTVYMGNANRHYVLFCNIKEDGCFTPSSDKNYLLFNANTRWKMPGAKDFLTLKFMQDWTVKYNQGENIGLIAEDPSTKDSGIGMFVLDKTGGGYEQDTIFSDGPIIYGSGMSHQDRQKAWKSFWRPQTTKRSSALAIASKGFTTPCWRTAIRRCRYCGRFSSGRTTTERFSEK